MYVSIELADGIAMVPLDRIDPAPEGATGEFREGQPSEADLKRAGYHRFSVAFTDDMAGMSYDEQNRWGTDLAVRIAQRSVVVWLLPVVRFRYEWIAVPAGHDADPLEDHAPQMS